MKNAHIIGFLLAFMCGWLVMDSICQTNQINEMQRYIGRKATEANEAHRLAQASSTNLPPLPSKPRISNADLAEAANLQAREQQIVQLFVKEQQQVLQRRVEEFLTLTEPLLLSTNLDRQALRNAIATADDLHAKLDSNSFNPILEIRFEARRGTLQSLVKQ